MQDEQPRGSVIPEAWPEILPWLINPLVFRDAKLGIVLVSGPDGDRTIWRIHDPGYKRAHHWCIVRKVDEREETLYHPIDALNLPPPEGQ